MQADLDFSAARQARDAAIAQTAQANPDWCADARRAVEYVAGRRPTFTSLDVWAHLETLGYPEPTDRRAMGAVMKWAVKQGMAAPLGYAATGRKASHCRPVRQYRSMIQ